MKNSLFFTFLFSLLICCLSCEKNQDLMSNSFSDFQEIKSEVYLYDKNKVAYGFKIKYQKNVAICERSIVGTYAVPQIHGKRFENFITDPQAFFDFSKQGKLWFIPNSSDSPKKITLNASHHSKQLNSRTSYASGTFYCFCESAGSDPLNANECVLDDESDVCYELPGTEGCQECDIEWCPDPPTAAGIPETRGGGVFLFADTVIIIDGNVNVVFGGRTKIDMELKNDTLYFSREYIYPTDIFEQYYFNATGSLLSSVIDSPDAWIIPFDLSMSVSPASDFKCISDLNDPCSADCEEEPQPNGCYRCKCTGTGDCDYVNEVTSSLAPFGILVVAENLSEIE